MSQHIKKLIIKHYGAWLVRECTMYVHRSGLGKPCSRRRQLLRLSLAETAAAATTKSMLIIIVRVSKYTEIATQRN